MIGETVIFPSSRGIRPYRTSQTPSKRMPHLPMILMTHLPPECCTAVATANGDGERGRAPRGAARPPGPARPAAPGGAAARDRSHRERAAAAAGALGLGVGDAEAA